eukprot:scaffold157575_cov63-Attheya_sp.AAC.1
MGGHGSGGKRKNAGRLAHQSGQLTLDGRRYSAQESRNRRQESPITVADARNRRDQENELQSNVKPWRRTTQNGLPRASLAQEKYVVFNSLTETENWALGMAEKVASLDKETFYGLDTECNLDKMRSITRAIGICFPPHLYDKVVVLDLTEMGALAAADFPIALRQVVIKI